MNNHVRTIVTTIRLINFRMGVNFRTLAVGGRRAGKSSLYRTVMMDMYKRANDIATGDVLATPYLTEIPERCAFEYMIQRSNALMWEHHVASRYFRKHTGIVNLEVTS